MLDSRAFLQVLNMKTFVAKHGFTREQVLRANEAMNRGDTTTLEKNAQVMRRIVGSNRSTAQEINSAFDAALRRIAIARAL